MVGVSLLIIVISVVVGRGGNDTDDGAGARPRATASPSVEDGPGTLPSQLPSSTPEPTPGSSAAATGAAPDSAPSGFAAGSGTLPPLSMPGLTGKGGSASLPKIRVRLEVFSQQPIGIVGYQVPTSLTDPSGTVKGVGTRWSLTTIAYGNPDYARLFFGAGPSGTPVTCVITINGKVTERRSTEGPYGQTMCQG
ncbi:hypothetical protein KVF89_28220 [Nocardioides carbamazepini]|uniref:hypothetical protein n=1 Tax=Nocardioides carbamazepini TaxID=2854259 RepID=UPI002149EFDF|nr:hypothetical protein [Nocardioides carbamazepini]MCR1786453.1 hypothetical protein [Nocardioides carbamazepini]